MTDNIRQLIGMLFPIIAITSGIGLAAKLMGMILSTVGDAMKDDPEPSVSRHIYARPIREMEPATKSHELHQEMIDTVDEAIQILSHKNHYQHDPNRCEYCGSRIKRQWDKCPGCGSSL